MNKENVLYKNSEGLRSHQLYILHVDEPKLTGDPDDSYHKELPIGEDLESAFLQTQVQRPNDFNGDKLSVTKIEVQQECLIIFTRLTDYFTLWGLPHAAPTLLEQSNHELDQRLETGLPAGLYAAPIIVTKDEKIIGAISSVTHGFGSGRLSFSFEEQSELEDTTPISTAVRGMVEEWGTDISLDQVIVVGIGKSTDIAYVSAYCIIELDCSANELISRKSSAVDDNEHDCVLAVPIAHLDKLFDNDLDVSAIKPFILRGKIDDASKIVHHRANLPRWELLKEHLGIIKP